MASLMDEFAILELLQWTTGWKKRAVYLHTVDRGLAWSWSCSFSVVAPTSIFVRGGDKRKIQGNKKVKKILLSFAWWNCQIRSNFNIFVITLGREETIVVKMHPMPLWYYHHSFSMSLKHGSIALLVYGTNSVYVTFKLGAISKILKCFICL